MARIRQSHPGTKFARPSDAWRKVAAAKLDTSLLHYTLRLTVWERLAQHQRALEIIQKLVETKKLPKKWWRLNLSYPAILKEYDGKKINLPSRAKL